MKDVNRLAKELPDFIGNFGVHCHDFAHTDFMFHVGKDEDKYVYEKVLDILMSIF
jgi:hypothetical protein